MTDLRENLTQSLDEARWDWLQPHLERDVVILVADNLDLVDVGVAIANDDTQVVGRWIDEQLLTKPSQQQRDTWEPEMRFRALIVQPYVLIQAMAAAPA